MVQSSLRLSVICHSLAVNGNYGYHVSQKLFGAVTCSLFVQSFPSGLRPSTLEERNEFYLQEFDVDGLTRWIGSRARQMKFAMIPGRHTGIVTPRHVRDKNNVVVIDDWTTSKDIREYALDYLPEGLYYDRNRYAEVTECARCGHRSRTCKGCYNYRGQQLAFDLDPENVDCPYH